MSLSVSSARPDELAVACRFLAAGRPVPERDRVALRYRDLLSSGELDPAGLTVARGRCGRIFGAMLAQILPGALGLVWPPRADAGCDRQTIEDALILAACDRLRAGGVKVGQTFAVRAERPDFAPLERHGFRLVTQVAHLRAAVEPDGPPIDDAIRLIPATHDRAALTAALLATYDRSRDCPELSGDRTPDELVEGFRSTGLRAGLWWFIVYKNEEVVGVLMWEPAMEPGVLELAYLGLGPAARGRGLGDELVRRSFSFARKNGFHAVNLSVDTRNEPALRLYQRHGFERYDERDVYLAAWPAESV